MPHSSLERRLSALEERHSPAARDAELAAVRERFIAKMEDLAARMVGREPDPATMTEAEQVACLLNTDPEAAVARIKASVAAALARRTP